MFPPYVLQPFRKHGVVLLAVYLKIYKKGDIVDITGWAQFKKESTTNVTMAKVEESTMSPSGGHCCKQIKGKILIKRIDVHFEHIKNSKSQDSFLKV